MSDIRVGPTYEMCGECGGTNGDGYEPTITHYVNCSKAPHGKRAKAVPTAVSEDELATYLMGGAIPSTSERGCASDDKTVADVQVVTNYVAIGRWTQCLHCLTLFRGDIGYHIHYCGAPWQTPPLGLSPDGVDQEWIDAVKARRMVNESSARTA